MTINNHFTPSFWRSHPGPSPGPLMTPREEIPPDVWAQIPWDLQIILQQHPVCGCPPHQPSSFQPPGGCDSPTGCGFAGHRCGFAPGGRTSGCPPFHSNEHFCCCCIQAMMNYSSYPVGKRLWVRVHLISL